MTALIGYAQAGHVRRFIGLSIALAAFLNSFPPATAQTQGLPKVLEQATLYYQPNKMGAGVKTVRRGENIIVRPTVWDLSAKVGSSVSIKTSEGMVVIPEGTILPAVKIYNLSGYSGVATAFCTVERKSVPDRQPSPWGNLLAKIEHSMEDGRKCLLDSDGDGLAELGFLLDDGQPSDRLPSSITPVALNVAEMRERESGNSVEISVVRIKRPGFFISISEQGKGRLFEKIYTDRGVDMRWQDAPRDAALPLDMDVYGARIRILESNDADHTLKVELVD